MFANTSAQALDVGIGNGGGVSADVGVGIGGVSADVGVSVGGSGGIGADVGASVGGTDGVNADVSVEVGSTGSGSGTGSGTGTGTGAGTGSGMGTGTQTATSSQGRSSTNGSPMISVSRVNLADMLGATVLTSDRKVVGMVENVTEGPNGTIDTVIRMNVAFGANRPTVRLRTTRPMRDSDRLQLGYTQAWLLSQIKG
ncbi:hypothetical protein [Pseudosulfitobacter koreensis]|uniref:PRC-barrel domain-containing protein n=1 Tax=Pseudosulfitobacter koreensis TaxID=2968472 RepID=A0ABT1Z0U0_9RHOB|nr:hypothetical protein [Pseudosulfitobacter koreense]MCR8826751.1 hypothetical protein [Pseudosulfitobacter koreense]